MDLWSYSANSSYVLNPGTKTIQKYMCFSHNIFYYWSGTVLVLQVQSNRSICRFHIGMLFWRSGYEKPAYPFEQEHSWNVQLLMVNGLCLCYYLMQGWNIWYFDCPNTSSKRKIKGTAQQRIPRCWNEWQISCKLGATHGHIVIACYRRITRFGLGWRASVTHAEICAASHFLL